MNILIINAFGNSQSGKAKFNSFFSIIKKIFKKVSESSGIENFHYIIRNPNNLSDYIFNFFTNPEDETVGMTGRQNFNSLDMVFIDGEEYYLPWRKKSHQLCEFVKLCKLGNKVLYAGGVAMEILIFYLATGSLNEHDIINANGEIKALEELSELSKNFLNQIKKNDNFLDYVTGDLLEYQNNEKIWEPIMNIGLHHQNTAEKYNSRGKFVLPEKNFNVKTDKKLANIYHEIKVFTVKQYLSYYLVQNLPLEFIVYSCLTWFPHFFNVSYKKYQFKIICQCSKGLAVIEHENSIGVIFHAQNNFHDSIQILENFINQKFNEVKEKLFKFKTTQKIKKTNITEISPIFKEYKENDDRLKGKHTPEEDSPPPNYTLVGKVSNSSSFNRIMKVKHEANHVGQGINNRDMIFVEKNFINQNTNYSMDKLKKKVLALSEKKCKYNPLIRKRVINKKCFKNNSFKYCDKKYKSHNNITLFNKQYIKKLELENEEKKAKKNNDIDNIMCLTEKRTKSFMRLRSANNRVKTYNSKKFDKNFFHEKIETDPFDDYVSIYPRPAILKTESNKNTNDVFKCKKIKKLNQNIIFSNDTETLENENIDNNTESFRNSKNRCLVNNIHRKDRNFWRIKNSENILKYKVNRLPNYKNL